MTITHFCIVRHGETDWNAEKRLQGQIDISLNTVGQAQAVALRTHLKKTPVFAAVYSSDLARAWHTAKIATADMDLAVSPAPSFRERHYGTHQGLTSAEAAHAYPAMYHLHQARDLHYAYDTGESLAAFAARIQTGLSTLAEQHRGQAVLIFTHGGVLDIIYRLATQRPLDTPRDFPIPNAGLNWINHDASLSAHRWQIITWGDQAHLTAALDELA
jgi:2,3-bisphosphoglycerate-dependent phosphoglycerate mutase